jgi:hypothetical protein
MLNLTDIHSKAVSREDLKKITDRAESCREWIEHILDASQTIMTLLENDRPVLSCELSGVITQAENINLVTRAGMKVSGLRYVVNETELNREYTNVSAEDGMTTAYHLYLQARRAKNVLDNPQSYRPCEKTRLYGQAQNGEWQPLIP